MNEVTLSNELDQALPAKPKYRGTSHFYGFLASLVMGTVIVLKAPNTKSAIAVSIYSVCISVMLGTSAAFHRHHWSPKARRKMRRLDHSMIFLAVAGTYTPVATLGLYGDTQRVILWLVWVGAAVGILQQMIWLDAPKWTTATVYLALGWVAIGVLPELTKTSGFGALSLLVIGGILYSLGAIVYARKRPDPWPKTFGYHEVFHLFVVAAVLCHYFAIFIFIMK